MALVDATGKITALSATELANLSGAALTSLTAENISAGTLGTGVKVSGDQDGIASLTMSTGTVTGNAFSVGGSTLIVKDGMIGIGKVPAVMLDILDGTTKSGLRVQSGGVNGTYYPLVALNYGGTKGVWLRDNGNLGINDNTADAQLDIVSDKSSTSFIFSVSSQSDDTGDIFSIKGNGNIGIGASSPNAKLHLSSGVFYNDGTEAGIYTTGNSTATKFYGDGTGLTGVIYTTATGTYPLSISGNASTASALAADPADCSLPNVSLGINASGTASCSQPSDVTGNAVNITGDLAASQVAAGSLGSGVIASSITLSAMYGAPTLTGTNITGIPAASIDAGSLGGSVIASSVAAGVVTDANLAGSISPSKITGTAAILGANTFTSTQTLDNGGIMFTTDGQNNIGAYHDNRPYKIYVASQVIVGNSMIFGSSNVTTSDGTEIFTIGDSGISSLNLNGASITQIVSGPFENAVATTSITADYGISSSSNVSAGWYQINGSTILSHVYEETVMVGLNACPDSVGSQNVCIGDAAGKGLTTGGYNAFLGFEAGLNLTEGSANTLAGYDAGVAITTGVNNTLIGESAGTSYEWGSNNVNIGSTVGNTSADGSNNILIGYAVQNPAGIDNYALNIGDIITGDMAAGSKYVSVDGYIKTSSMVFTGAAGGGDTTWTVDENDGMLLCYDKDSCTNGVYLGSNGDLTISVNSTALSNPNIAMTTAGNIALAGLSGAQLLQINDDPGVTISTTVVISAGVSTGGALCLNSSNVLSKCTSVTDASGNCTCP